MFANGPGDRSSILGQVIPKTLKTVLDTFLLNTQQYKVLIKGKIEQSRERVAPSSTPRCSSYRKGSLLVALNYGRQLYFIYIYIYNFWWYGVNKFLIYIYIYIYIYMCVYVCVCLSVSGGVNTRI